MNCPACGHVLEATQFERVAVHDCTNCGGMWLERDKLRQAADNTDEWVRWLDFDVTAGAEAGGEHGARRCPVCNEEMTVYVYPHSTVKIDVCPSDHGVWLDKDEFAKIIEALDTLTNELSSHDLERAALHELREVVSGGHESRLSEVRDFMTVFRLLEMRLGTEHPLVANAVNLLGQQGL